jgi:hypothetical protein
MAKAIVDSWVVAPTKNIQRSIEFYSKLGLKPSRRMPDYVEFKVPGGTVLGLYSSGREKGKKAAEASRSDGALCSGSKISGGSCPTSNASGSLALRRSLFPTAVVCLTLRTRMETGWSSSSSVGDQKRGYNEPAYCGRDGSQPWNRV